MAKKPVRAGPEQERERTREMGAGLKRPALVVLETTPYLTQRKNALLEKIQTVHGRFGVSNNHAGVFLGVLAQSKITKPNTHAG